MIKLIAPAIGVVFYQRQSDTAEDNRSIEKTFALPTMAGIACGRYAYSMYASMYSYTLRHHMEFFADSNDQTMTSGKSPA